MGQLLRRARRVLQGKLAALLEDGRAGHGASATQGPAFAPEPEEAGAAAPRGPEIDPRARAFAILEVAPGVTRDELRAAYLRLCRRYHPDHFDHDSAKSRAANELLAEINAAYELLTGSG